MQLGMIRLGRKGASLVRRLTKDADQCVVYDVYSAAVKKIAGRDHVTDSGEGRWTIAAVNDEAAPSRVFSAALYERFGSSGDADFANRVLSAIRKQFGGHDEKRGST